MKLVVLVLNGILTLFKYDIFNYLGFSFGQESKFLAQDSSLPKCPLILQACICEGDCGNNPNCSCGKMCDEEVIWYDKVGVG